ncbi:galactoside alpha-(1,2)-fucosyltransferase 2-like [Gigantopelta aegis]|uniref:galactoside alpha-(1,2)-fucosyltransferase 2-like n=1 Tax=Gigantopelta aegis TaxID=1735272 RepID=UPI001B887968|nr:galactoside alpha-(1,2)-fucosyltransferase 2-like [Gigantopelta aegis]
MIMAVVKERPLNTVFALNATKVDKSVCANTTPRVLSVCCIYDKTFLNFPSNSNYRLGDYLQSWKYFQNHTAAIRKQFTFNKTITAKAQELLHNVMVEYKRRTSNVSDTTNAEQPTFIGVHIRRTDFANSVHKSLGYPLASKEYIVKAMEYYTNKFSKVIFLICSDSIDWVKSNFNSSNMFYSVGNSPEVDMCILSSCNHSIMTVGTFGWWASFLAGGETVHYKHLARKGSKLRREYSSDYKDYFYPGWIGMD